MFNNKILGFVCSVAKHQGNRSRDENASSLRVELKESGIHLAQLESTFTPSLEVAQVELQNRNLQYEITEHAALLKYNNSGTFRAHLFFDQAREGPTSRLTFPSLAGQIGANISFFDAMKHFLESEEEYFLWIEDDVELLEDWPQTLEKSLLEVRSSGFDFINFSNYRAHQVFYERNSHLGAFKTDFESTVQSFQYQGGSVLLISRRGATEIVKLLERVGLCLLPFDAMISNVRSERDTIQAFFQSYAIKPGEKQIMNFVDDVPLAGESSILQSARIVEKTFDEFVQEDFASIYGYVDPRVCEVLRALFSNQDLQYGVAEVGVYHGKFFILLRHLLRHNRPSLAIDVFSQQELNIDGSGVGDPTEYFQSNLSSRDKWRGLQVEIIAGDSTDSQVQNKVQNCFSIFSIDGGHTRLHALSDIHFAEEHLALDGVMILDDFFHPGWPGVTEALFDYLSDAPKYLPFLFAYNKLFLCHFSQHERYLQESALNLKVQEVEIRKFRTNVCF